jgi:hypothetical protein
MKARRGWALLAVAALLAVTAAPALAQGSEQKLSLTGINYTKWLWGNQRFDGGLYNFTTVPGEGFGDNGQGTELEILVASKPSSFIEVSGRLKARFNQNFWTNFGGFGGRNPALEDPPAGDCLGGDCGEFDSRSAQYVKFRGLTVRLTPGYSWVDAVTIGSSDWGMFDPFSIGKIRYIDRDNGSGLLFQGAFADRKLTYDFARISLPRLWAGPNFQTGEFTTQDAAYGLQLTYRPTTTFDVAGVFEYVNDIEVDATDFDLDNGRDLRTRFRNDVTGVRIGVHPSPKYDVKGAIYFSSADSDPALGAPETFFGLSGFSPVPAGQVDDETWKANLDLFDPFGVGLSFNVEVFDVGAQYVSMMAARRESDVLLTEGHDGAWAFPGPANAAFGVFSGNPTRIGYGGWQGNAQQVATINVDNEFTDFDEPMAETVIGWKGVTLVPTWSIGALNLAAEYSWIDYNTNWQAFDDPSRPVTASIYPVHELDTGVGHNFRSAYAPFQDKTTNIAVLKGDYLLGVGKGVDLSFKLKYIDEQDDRLTDPRFLPYEPGDCPGGGTACSGDVRFYSPGNSTADIYGNPPVITVDGVTGYQWKPFDSVADDDRDISYYLYRGSAGYQLTDQLYASVAWERYDVDLKDGNTAFQAYQLHELASGEHTKDKLILIASYVIGGAELGLDYEYNTGDFKPDFGGGFVPQVADEEISRNFNVPVDSLGFFGRFGGWNSLEKRSFDQQRLKAFMKVRF